MAKPAPKSQCPASLSSKHFANVDSIVPTRPNGSRWQRMRVAMKALGACDKSFTPMRQKLWGDAAKALSDNENDTSGRGFLYQTLSFPQNFPTNCHKNNRFY